MSPGPIRTALAGLIVLLASGACELSGGRLRAHPAEADEDVWAIRCLTLRGSSRFRMADRYAKALRNVAGLKPDLVRVFHRAGESIVYYGRYQRVYNANAAAESFRPDHLPDLNLIRHLSLTVQDPAAGSRLVWPFQLATMDTLPGGPGSHPEWQLSGAPGYYSLQVAVFYNTAGMRRRKYAAEKYCKLLREQGEQAYYDHGPVNSSVCIGAFPKEAIRTIQRRDPLTGIIHVKSKIVDEDMLALERRFPYNLNNGSIFYDVNRDPRTGKESRVPYSSFPVIIPKPPAAEGLAGR